MIKRRSFLQGSGALSLLGLAGCAHYAPLPLGTGSEIIGTAQIGGVVYGTSIETLQKLGIDQIRVPATAVIKAAPFYVGEILGHVLESETDALFLNRKRD